MGFYDLALFNDALWLNKLGGFCIINSHLYTRFSKPNVFLMDPFWMPRSPQMVLMLGVVSFEVERS